MRTNKLLWIDSRVAERAFKFFDPDCTSRILWHLAQAATAAKAQWLDGICGAPEAPLDSELSVKSAVVIVDGDVLWISGGAAGDIAQVVVGQESQVEMEVIICKSDDFLVLVPRSQDGPYFIHCADSRAHARHVVELSDFIGNDIKHGNRLSPLHTGPAAPAIG